MEVKYLSLNSSRKKLVSIIVNELTDDLKKLIKKNISVILVGREEEPEILVNEINDRIYNTHGKPKDNHISGFLAELLVHLYLNKIGGKQYSILQNIEESSSFKKGFDAMYEVDGLFFFVESKSTVKCENKKIISQHSSNIIEANNYMDDKLMGIHRNNPWRNAVFHAQIMKANSNIIDYLRRNSKEWLNRDTELVREQKRKIGFIPNSTLFTENDKEINIDENTLKKTIISLFSSTDYKKVIAVCFSNKFKSDLINFLEKDLFKEVIISE